MRNSQLEEFGRIHKSKIEEIVTLSDEIIESDQSKVTILVDTSVKHNSEENAGFFYDDPLIIAETQVNDFLESSTYFDEFDKAESEALNKPKLLICEAGLLTQPDTFETNKGFVDLSRVSLVGLEKYMTATRHSIVLDSDITEMTLFIDKIGDQDSIPEVHFKDRNKQHYLAYDQAASVLSSYDMKDITDLLMNSYANSEIDQKLFEIKLNYKGSSMEWEVSNVLNSLRKSIILNRSEIEFNNIAGNIKVPLVEQLDYITEELYEIKG